MDTAPLTRKTTKQQIVMSLAAAHNLINHWMLLPVITYFVVKQKNARPQTARFKNYTVLLFFYFSAALVISIV